MRLFSYGLGVLLLLVAPIFSYVSKQKKDDVLYGYDRHLRSPDAINPVRSGKCGKRHEDSRLVCLPDVIFLGASKTGRVSIFRINTQTQSIRIDTAINVHYLLFCAFVYILCMLFCKNSPLTSLFQISTRSMQALHPSHTIF